MTADTILVPTDGSDVSESAARRAFALAAQLDATVHLLGVVDTNVVAGGSYLGGSSHIRERLHEAANTWVGRLSADATDRGIEHVTAVETGVPAATIIDYAAEHGIDVIAMGTAGRGGVARMVVGSVTDKVVRTAPVPVLTVNQRVLEATNDDAITSLLLPTDGSDPAEAAARRGLDLAARLGATVHILSAADTDVAGGLLPLDDPDDITDQLLDRADDNCASIATEAADRGLDVVTVTREGTPAGEIVEYTADNDIDMIVMGTQGRGGFERLVVGSVADSVVRKAPVPVMTVRPDGDR